MGIQRRWGGTRVDVIPDDQVMISHLRKAPTPIALARRLGTARTGEDSFSVLGRKYEEACQELLVSLGISTRLVGGASDGGIDLIGHWQLEPSLSVPVIAQCKKIGRACPPVYLRELEGTLARHPAGTVGMLICSSEASKASLAMLNGSATPLIFMHFDMASLCSAFINGSVQRLLPRLIVGSRHAHGRVEPAFFYVDPQ